MLMTVIVAAAVDSGVPTSAAQAISAVSTGAALGASGSSAWLVWRGNRDRRETNRELILAATDRGEVEQLYLALIRGAEARSNRAFMASMVAGIGAAAAIVGGAATGLLFGMPDVGIFTTVTGAVPASISILLGRASTTANRDVKEYFQQLAESRERDREVDRTIRLRSTETDNDDYYRGERDEEERQLELEGRSGFADDVERGHPWNSGARRDGNRVTNNYFYGHATADGDDVDEEVLRDR